MTKRFEIHKVTNIKEHEDTTFCKGTDEEDYFGGFLG